MFIKRLQRLLKSLFQKNPISSPLFWFRGGMSFPMLLQEMCVVIMILMNMIMMNLRDGFTKKCGQVWWFAKLPSTPPPPFGLFPHKKIWPLILFFENEHVLGVQEWSYVVPEKWKTFFFFKNRVWFGVTPPPPPVRQNTSLFRWFFCETFPYSHKKSKGPPGHCHLMAVINYSSSFQNSLLAAAAA